MCRTTIFHFDISNPNSWLRLNHSNSAIIKIKISKILIFNPLTSKTESSTVGLKTFWMKANASLIVVERKKIQPMATKMKVMSIRKRYNSY